ncbi:MAG: hypothetical protein A3K90_03810 [Pelodictyon luteolum]|uniref:Methyltransferase type 12 n=1 Tax=Pelodictyon luteolum TaxID=1100 RepID=A0A165LT02_PELLU|nr:class I SAM-dependent methyltransferase [Pelodictyon luteolum]KZK74390.1 MAG: hypothetical protein A3K90_03810 [Pelodictyon luteolum]
MPIDPVPFLTVPDRFTPEKGDCWPLALDPETGIISLLDPPGPLEMAAHYRHNAYSPHLQKAESIPDRLYLAASALLLHRRARLVAKGIAEPGKARVLEIGCARGTLLEHLALHHGFSRSNMIGIEPDPASASFARERFKLTLYPSLSDLPPLSGPFQRIVLWHALEHLPELDAALGQLSRLLAPEGRLLITLPNPSGLDAAHYGPDWVAWDAPRHLWHFPSGTLERLAETYGLRRMTFKAWAPDALFNAYMSEELRCRRGKQGMHAARKALALLKGGLFALRGMLKTEDGAGIVREFRRGKEAPGVQFSPPGDGVRPSERSSATSAERQS